MKRFITFLLIAAMLVCMVPAFAVTVSAAEEPQQGLNATFWHSVAEVEEGESGHADAWRRLMGWNGMGQSTSYETNEWFDESIDQMVKISHKWPTVGDGKLGFGEGFLWSDYKVVSGNKGNQASEVNDYLVQWTGTMKATTAGTYTFVANALDNGVAIFVDDEKAFEWWGPDTWFENESLLSKYTFTITEDQVGKDIPFEMWFLEMFGDERLKMSVTMNGTADGQKSLEEAGLTFALSATYYTCLLNGEYDDVAAHMTQGDGKDADNAVNHTFSEEQLTAIKGEMMNVGTALIDNMESNTFFEKRVFEQFGAHYNGFLIEYSGYLTPLVSGEYQFGTAKVDNCYILQLKIDGQWKTVYEFWAKGIWNDSYTTYSADKFNLTAGTSYELRAIFLELDGGEPLETKIKINGTEYDASGVLLTTEPYAKGQAPTKSMIFDAGAEWKYQLGSMENGNAPAAPAGWPTSIASTMQTGTAPMKDEWTTSDNPADGTQANAYIWLAKEFTVDDIDDYKDVPLMTDMYYDDDIRVYVNGTEVYNYSRWNTGMTAYKLLEDASELLVEGKNVIAVSLHQHHGGWDFDMRLYTTTADTSAYFPMYTAVDTADELIAYAKMASDAYAVDRYTTHSAILDITADISMKGKTWAPITGFVGDIKGNGHTISDIVYVNTDTNGNKGLIVNDLANYWVDNQPVENGTIRDLTVKNSLLYAPNSEWNAVGAIAGKLDRGCVYNCTVEDVTVIGGDWVGGIVGRAESGSINGALETPVMDCTIKNSTVISTMTTSTSNKAVGGIVGTNDSRSKLLLGDYVMENVVIMCDESVTLKAEVVGAPDTSEGCAPVHGENASVKNVKIVNTAAAAVTAGASTSWNAADAKNVTITLTATDNAITAVKVNGETLKSSYYTLKETEEKVTVVTLKESYLKSLGTGEYTVSVESYEGNAEASLSVINEAPVAPPQTGDAILFLALIATLSLAGAVLVSKKRSCEK